VEFLSNGFANPAGSKVSSGNPRQRGATIGAIRVWDSRVAMPISSLSGCSVSGMWINASDLLALAGRYQNGSHVSRVRSVFVISNSSGDDSWGFAGTTQARIRYTA
jgi:hypothetical protein